MSIHVIPINKAESYSLALGLALGLGLGLGLALALAKPTSQLSIIVSTRNQSLTSTCIMIYLHM